MARSRGDGGAGDWVGEALFAIGDVREARQPLSAAAPGSPGRSRFFNCSDAWYAKSGT